jgi:hypothetical protein
MQRYIQAHNEHCIRAGLEGFRPVTLSKFLDIAFAIELGDLK